MVEQFTEELWEPISGTNGRYSVSNLGNVRCNGYEYLIPHGNSVHKCFRKPHFLRRHKDSLGYERVTIGKKDALVSRLVAIYFIDNPQNKPCVNHISGDKSDNRATNLEWVTVAENNIHALRNGLRPSGGDYPYSKLTNEQVREIRANHKPKTRGCGCKALARKYGVHHSVIQNILNGTTWRYIDGNGSN